MKKTKRILSMLLCLALVIGFIPVFTMPAQAAEGTWTLVTDASSLAAGDQVIIAATDYNYALSTTQNGNNRGRAGITKDGSTVTFGSDVQVLTLENGTATGSFAFSTGDDGYLYAAGGTGKNNYLRTKTTLDATASFNITIKTASTGAVTIKCADATVARNTIMYNNSNSIFSCYASGQQDICLYKLVENTCEHTDWEWEVDASGHHKVCQNEECSEKFFTCTKTVTYTTTETQHTPVCDCGYTGTTADHEFGDYTPVEGGHNRVCGVCEYIEETAECEDSDSDGNCDVCYTAVGCAHEWEDAYNETQHYQVCALCGSTKGEENHETAKTYDDETHTSTCDCGYSVTEKHVLTNGACSGCDFTMKSEAAGSYVKVTDVSDLAVGDKVVIVANDSDFAMSTEQKTNNRGQAEVTKNGDTVTFGDDVQIITLGEGTTSGTFAFYTGTDGYLYASSSSSNYLKTKSELDEGGNSYWMITIADGIATIVAQGDKTHNTIRYNSTSSLFGCYLPTNTMLDICIYKYVENDTEVNVFQADTRLKDTLNLAFHFTVDTTDEVVKAGALITIGDETYNYTATAGTGYYSVEVSGIYAQSIDTMVYIKPYAEFANGLVYGEEKSTSVLKCLEYMYNNENESKETKDVIRDLLNYANAARNYFVAKGTMDAPAQAFNNALAEADRVLAWDDEYRADLATVEETTGDFEPVNGKVFAGIQEALRLRVEFEDPNVAGFVYWNEAEYAANSGNHTVATGTQTFVMDGDVAKGYIENIYAYEMYENFYFRAYNAEGELSETYTRSIAAYVTKEMDDNAGDEAYVELCQAMLIYGNTAMTSDAIVKG